MDINNEWVIAIQTLIWQVFYYAFDIPLTEARTINEKKKYIDTLAYDSPW